MTSQTPAQPLTFFGHPYLWFWASKSKRSHLHGMQACTARISFRLKATSKNDAAGAYLTHAEVVQVCTCKKEDDLAIAGAIYHKCWLPAFKHFAGHALLQAPSDGSLLLQEAHRFVQQLQTGHDEACPWRKDACDAGLAVFPALLPDDVKTGFDQRVESLTVLSCLPPLKESAMESLCKQRRQVSRLLWQQPHQHRFLQ